MAANDSCSTPRRLYITDAYSKLQFLIDTGADLCMFPRNRIKGTHVKYSYVLTAANGTSITTYGFVTLSLKLGLGPNFSWRFRIADISKPIISVDFLCFYGFLVDVRNQRLCTKRRSLLQKGIWSLMLSRRYKLFMEQLCSTIFFSATPRSPAQTEAMPQ